MTCKKRTQTQLPLESLAEAVPAKHSEWPPAAMADLAAGRARLIPLTMGRFALVDADMFDALSNCKWQYQPAGGYAMRSITNGQKVRAKLMHRVILETPRGLFSDHVNRIRLDNRRCNLRICTRVENARNRLSSNATGFKGVKLDTRRKTPRYEAAIKADGKRYHLGSFSTAEDAHAAYVSAARLHHGEFASFLAGADRRQRLSGTCPPLKPRPF